MKMKYLYKLLKKVIVSFGILYAYNLLMHHFNLPIPINLYTLSFITVFGIPGFVGLIIAYIINY